MANSKTRAAMRKGRQQARKQSVSAIVGDATADDAKNIKQIFLTYGHKNAAAINEHNKAVRKRGSRHQRRMQEAMKAQDRRQKRKEINRSRARG